MTGNVVAFRAGLCCTPRCGRSSPGASMCNTCWFDLTEDERFAVRMAQVSPYSPQPDLHALESRLALTASARALARRRFRKAAARRLKHLRKAA